MAKDLDVVVFGASGLTGRQVAGYLDRRARETGATWAAAGRNEDKVRRELAEIGVTASEIIVADVSDQASLVAMTERTKVVLNLVGPYTRFGRPVIAACVEGGAHYADLTGEIPFVREMIDEFDAAAGEAGVKIVEVSGFEALPADMSVRLAVEAVKERFGEPPASIDLEATMTGTPPGLPRPSDVLSGGTLQSVAVIASSDSEYDFTDPACLVADPARAERIRALSPIKIAPRRGLRGDPLAPMMPAAFINPAVIHRASALAGDDQPFRYREGMAIPGPGVTLPLRFAAAGAASGMQLGMGSLGRGSEAFRAKTGALLEKALPKSGFGPSVDRLEDWSWRIDTTGTCPGGSVHVVLEAEGHPGYLTTAYMLGEAGLLMAEDGATPDRAGCLTPAVALGTASAQRFSHAQMRFWVE